MADPKLLESTPLTLADAQSLVSQLAGGRMQLVVAAGGIFLIHADESLRVNLRQIELTEPGIRRLVAESMRWPRDL